MKRIISLIVCLFIAISVSACGKNNDSGEMSDFKKPDETVENSQQNSDAEENDKKTSGESEKKSDAEVSQDESVSNENAADVRQLPVDNAEQLEKMVDEFNNTDDPNRKEELRKELEEILKQAEQMSQEK